MNELIKRLQALTAPCREVQADIHCLVDGWERRWNEKLEITLFWKGGRWISYGSIPPYLSSIDSAMTLVPEGWDWQLQSSDTGDFLSCFWSDKLGINDIYERGVTPAIALCIAALKATQ